MVVQNNSLRFILFKFNNHRHPRGAYDNVLNFSNLISLSVRRFIFSLKVFVQFVIWCYRMFRSVVLKM